MTDEQILSACLALFCLVYIGIVFVKTMKHPNRDWDDSEDHW